MAKIKIDASTTGTGTFTISAPNSNTDRTLTLPDTTAALVTTASPDFTGDVTFDTSTLVIDSTNNRVGIGTTSPDWPLHVATNNGFIAEFQSTASADYRPVLWSDSSGTSVGMLGADFTADEFILKAFNKPLVFGSGADGSERMRIDSSGNVLVGTTSTTNLADTDVVRIIGNTNGVDLGGSASTGAVRLRGSDTGAGIVDFSKLSLDPSSSPYYNGRIFYSFNDNFMRFETNGSEKMRITSSGYVGIGTTSPSAPLHVHGNLKFNTTNNDGNEQRALFNVGGAGDPFSMTMYKADASTIGTYITADGSSYFTGYVGIGETSPGAKLHAKIADATGAAAPSATYDFAFENTDATIVNIISQNPSNGTSYGRVAFSDNDRNNGFITYNHNENRFRIATAGTERVFIDSSGRVTMPYQPAFHVDSNHPTTTTSTFWIANSTKHNVGGHYSTSTGRFTAPVDGIYHFYLQLFINTTNTCQINFYKNGAGFSEAKATAESAYDSMMWTRTVELNANDYIQVQWATNTSALQGGTYTFWGGYLLG